VPVGITSHALSRTNSSSSNADRRPTRQQRLEPPVTKATLSELDVNKIIHNPKLRHDINFDPELHFRPNLDGEKGRRKQEKANQFWNSLLDQLFQFVVDRQAFRDSHPDDDDWCLPQLLKTVKEIIQTLVPQRDRDLLNDGLNVELLMQQFNRGVADLEKLASWLSGVLKLHCAPMRDEWVDEMYKELSNGNRNNDMGELVKGMRTLLSVLEAMKLDVANHQIRCLRPVLIEDTVHFEQRFFLKKIQGGKLNVDGAKEWYQKAQQAAEAEGPSPHAQSLGEMTTFFGAVSKLILPSTPVEAPNSNICPNTFLFDEERILKLRSDIYDAICIEICMRQYDELERMASFQTTSSLAIPAYVADDSEGSFGTSPPSRPSSFVWSDSGSSSAHSPRNSGCSFTGQPTVDTAESKLKARNLYNSLLALLQTCQPASRPAQRWATLSQAMAVQILRYVNTPQISLSELEVQLAKKLGSVEGEAFQEVEAVFHQRLLSALAKRVKEFKNLSGVGLFSVATGGRVNGPSRNWEAAREQRDREFLGGNGNSSGREPREEAGLDDMATRLAHLGVLHWRVWSQIAYDVAATTASSSAAADTVDDDHMDVTPSGSSA
jgi:hypothetical protein